MRKLKRSQRAATKRIAQSPKGKIIQSLKLASKPATLRAGKPGAGKPVLLSSDQPATLRTQSGVDLTDKIKALMAVAQEQGYLTYDDISEALGDTILSPAELDEIYGKLGNLEIEIVDQAEVERVKQPVEEPEEEKAPLDILDDPVRMYLSQMGKVPLLTREQEVEICKRIESAENEVRRILYSFGFAAKEHIALAEKLLSEPPKERFD